MKNLGYQPIDNSNTSLPPNNVIAMSKIGLIGELTKKQTNRYYFSDIPVGTKFIVTEEHNDFNDYELTGYFLYTIPQICNKSTIYYTGYIEKGTYKIIGTAEEFFLKNKIEIDASKTDDSLYTQEEVKFYATRFAHQCRLKECTTNNDTCNLFDKWFEQYKKK